MIVSICFLAPIGGKKSHGVQKKRPNLISLLENTEIYNLPNQHCKDLHNHAWIVKLCTVMQDTGRVTRHSTQTPQRCRTTATEQHHFSPAWTMVRNMARRTLAYCKLGIEEVVEICKRSCSLLHSLGGIRGSCLSPRIAHRVPQWHILALQLAWTRLPLHLLCQ